MEKYLSQIRNNIKHYQRGENYDYFDDILYVYPVYTSRKYRLSTNFYDNRTNNTHTCCLCLGPSQDCSFYSCDAQYFISGGYCSLLDNIKVLYKGQQYINDGRVCTQCLRKMDEAQELDYIDMPIVINDIDIKTRLTR